MSLTLDIVFQSGEFFNQPDSWWLNLLNTVIGVIIGSGVTIWALYRTFKQDKINDEKKRLEFQQEKVQYLQSLIRSILKDLNIQIFNYKKYADEILKDPLELPLFQRVPLNELERVVHKINQEDYYHAYLGSFGNQQEIIDEFRNIISLLNYFDGMVNLNQETLQRGYDFDYERKLKMKNLVEKSMDDTAGFLINNEILENQHDFWKFLTQTIVDFHREKHDRSDLRYYHENFVEVVKKGMIDFAKSIPEAHYLISQMKNATYIYSDISQQNEYIAKKFEGIHNDIRMHYSKLESLTKRLMNYKNDQ